MAIHTYIQKHFKGLRFHNTQWITDIALTERVQQLLIAPQENKTKHKNKPAHSSKECKCRGCVILMCMVVHCVLMVWA